MSAPPITVSRKPHRRSGLGFTTASIDRVSHPVHAGEKHIGRLFDPP